MSTGAAQVQDASVRYPASAEGEDLPPGYKRTEVGVIPEDWEVRSIRDIGQIKTGPFGTLLKAEEYSHTDGVPLISVGEVGAGSLEVSEQTPRVPEQVTRRLPQYVLRTGDIVFGRKGAVDRSALVAHREDGWFLGSDGMSVRPLKSCFAPYLAWQFQRYQVQEWLLQNAIGTTMASLNQGILSRVRVPYAPPPEQRAIAEALSDVDGLLGALEALIAKKWAIKQAAMQQLLTGKTRLPGFSGAWETKRLGEIGAFSKGRGVRRDDVVDDGLPCIRYGELYTRYHNYVTTPISRISPHVAPTAWPIKTGDLLFASSGETAGEIGTCAAYLGREQAFAGGDIVVLSPFGQNSMYLGHLMNHPLVATQKARFGQGDAVVHISAKNLAQIETALPRVDEQDAIAAVLSDMDAEIATLQRRRDKTRDIKQGMMQQLLTGRVRLVERGRTADA